MDSMLSNFQKHRQETNIEPLGGGLGEAALFPAFEVARGNPIGAFCRANAAGCAEWELFKG